MVLRRRTAAAPLHACVHASPVHSCVAGEHAVWEGRHFALAGGAVGPRGLFGRQPAVHAHRPAWGATRALAAGAWPPRQRGRSEEGLLPASRLMPCLACLGGLEPSPCAQTDVSSCTISEHLVVSGPQHPVGLCVWGVRSPAVIQVMAGHGACGDAGVRQPCTQTSSHVESALEPSMLLLAAHASRRYDPGPAASQSKTATLSHDTGPLKECTWWRRLTIS